MVNHLQKSLILIALAALSACSSEGAAPASTTAASGTSAPPSATSRASAAATTAASATSTAAATAAPPPGFIDSVAWAPAGDRIAIWCGATCNGKDDAAVPFHVVDLPSGAARTAAVPDTSGQLGGVSFSDKGTFVLAYAGSKIVVLKTADLSQAFATEHLAVYGVMGLSPDEKLFAAADAYGFADVTDLATGKEIEKASLHDPNAGYNQQLAWLPKGDRVVFGCADECTPELWGVKGKRIAKLKVDNATWSSSELVVTPANSVVVASSDGTVALFDGTDGKGAVLRKKLTKSVEPGRVAVALSADGKKLAVARNGTELVVFDLDTKKPTTVIAAKADGPAVETVMISQDGARVAFGNTTASYEVRATENASPDKLKGTPEGYADGGTLVVRDGDALVGLAEGKEKWRASAPSIAPPQDSPAYPAALAFSRDRKVVATAVKGGKLHLIRVTDGKTATLALEPKGASFTLAPQAGTTAADVTAILGK